jgi:hypothetical protein
MAVKRDPAGMDALIQRVRDKREKVTMPIKQCYEGCELPAVVTIKGKGQYAHDVCTECARRLLNQDYIMVDYDASLNDKLDDLMGGDQNRVMIALLKAGVLE